MTAAKSKGATKRREPLPFKKWLKRVGLLVVVLIGSLAIWQSSVWLLGITWQPMAIKSHQVKQTLVYQDETELGQVLNGFNGQSLLFLDLVTVKEQIENLPWIKSASVMKRWPGELVISLQEHEPVAYWNSEQVLNSEGIPLTKPVASMALAELNGPQDQSESVMQQYLQFAQVFKDQAVAVKQVKKEPRGSWALQLSNGIEVKLGEEHVLERSRRVVKVLIAQQLKPNSIEYIDARYPNGVAIKYIKQNELEAPDDIAA